jgi:hypothetical protein
LPIEQKQGLSEDEISVQETVSAKVLANLPALVLEYRTKFGNLVATDLARELFSEYTASLETRLAFAVAVQKSAAYLADQVFAEMVVEDRPGAALFTAGGTGAGKSSAISSFSETSQFMSRAHIVYDSNFNSEKGAFAKVDAALTANRLVTILFVHRHPIEAYLKGVIPRAQREGRTVPIDGHLRMHGDAIKVVRKALKKYRDNPKFAVVISNNTGHEAEASTITAGVVEYLNGIRYDNAELLRAIRQGLDHAKEHGQITEELYKRSCGTS